MKFHRDVDAFSLARIEATLVGMGVLRVELLPSTKDILYRWIGDEDV